MEIRRFVSWLVCFTLLLTCFTSLPAPSMAETGNSATEPVTETTAEPTIEPTAEPTIELTAEPTIEPTVEPAADIPVNDLAPEPTGDLNETPSLEPSADTQPEATPAPSSEAAAPTEPLPSLQATAQSGYASVNRSDAPIYEKKSTSSSISAYLNQDDIVYVSERIQVDLDNPESDWLFCHFDSERGVIDGFMHKRQLRFLTEGETQEFLLSISRTEDYAAYADHPLKRIDCAFPDEMPAPETAVTEPPVNDGVLTPPEADATETPSLEPSPTPTADIAAEITSEPPEEPTAEPSMEPTAEPTAEPTQIPVSSITLEASEMVLTAGTQRIVHALVEPAGASDPSILWASSDESVLLVDAAGNVTAVREGSAVITATAADASGIFAQCAVTVYPPVTSLLVTGQSRIQVGKTYPFTALDNETPVISSLVVWSSSDAAVAAVDASGSVTGIMAGNAVITAAVQGSPELRFDFPVEVIRATVVTMTDSNKQFSIVVSQNNNTVQEPGMSAMTYSEFSLMRLLLKTDGTMPAVDEYNPDIVIGNKDNRFMIQFTSVAETEAAYNVLLNSGYVKYVAPDSIKSLSDKSKAQSSYTYHSWGASAMHADTANEGLAATVSGSVQVAIIDTGISTHSFLSGKRLIGYDYVDSDTDPSDENGHGTHVAGTVVDLTQALNVSVVAYRVLDADGYGYDSDILNAMFDAADAGCDIINLSLGGDYSPSGYTAYSNAVSYATSHGVVVVCAAGNESGNTSYYIPACITLPGCIVTASVDSSLVSSYFSNYGSSVDVTAPGRSISSCDYTGGYVSMSGTSMAAPHISAACAMIMLSHPEYGPSQVEASLKGLCSDLGAAGYDTYYGYGIPNLSLLYSSEPEPTPAPDLTPTEITFDSSIEIGREIYFDSGVINSGDADSGPFSVKWEIDGIQKGYGLHNSVPANTTVMDGNSSLFWTPTSPGSYTVKFTVDCDNGVTEENESNNSVTVTVVVPEPVYKPDLAPLDITFDSDVTVGQTVYFDTGVINSGDGDSGTFAVKWEVDGVQMAYGWHTSVPAHTTVMDGNSSFSWTPTSPGMYFVRFTVDCDYAIDEENEFNNNVLAVVFVTEPVYEPDLAPLDITYSTDIAVGQPVYFDTGVINSGDGDSGAFAVKWEVDNIQMYYGLHSSVPANATVMDGNSSFSWTPASPGSYIIKFTVDCDNDIYEEDEFNNSVTVTVVVPEPSKPDLVPDSISYYAEIITGNSIVFNSGFANYGRASTNAFATKWEVNGEQISYSTQDGLPAYPIAVHGYSQLLWTPPSPGYYTITFTVDCDNSIIEENESNNQASVTVYAKPAPPQSIAISHSSLTIGVGQGIGVLSVSVLPADANAAIAWSSMNNGVAAVSNTGYIWGTGIGSTIIRASTVNGLYKDCTVNVVKSGKGVVGLSLSKTSAAIDEGKTLKLTVKYVPRSPSNKTVAWSSSNPSVASVDSKGSIFGVAPGSAVITATASSGISAQCTVTVNSLAAAQVILSKTYLAVDEGKTASLTASVLPRNARFKTITWSSSDPGIASVSARGKITTYLPGTVQITATAHNGVTAACTLVVRSLAVTSVSLNKSALTLKLGRSATLRVYLLPQNARYKTVAWVSSNPNVATVTTKGRIKAVGSGTAIITAIAHNGISASCTVTVP